MQGRLKCKSTNHSTHSFPSTYLHSFSVDAGHSLIMRLHSQLFLTTSILSLPLTELFVTVSAREPRLYRFERRKPAISDSCSYIDTNLTSLIGEDVPSDSMLVRGCVCRGTIPAFIQSGPMAQAAEVLGYERIEASLDRFVSALI